MNKFAGRFACAAKGLTVAVVTTAALCAGVFASACNVHEHSLEKVNAVQPTCIAEGRAEYWKCSGCDEMFSDAEGKNAVTENELVLAKGAHSYNLGVTIEEGVRYAGDYISEEELSYSLKCSVCGDEQAAGEVTADLDKALVEGANNFVVTSGEYTAVLTVIAQADGKRPSSLAVELAAPDAVFHAGQTVKSSHFTVTYKVEGKPDQTVTDFKITNPVVGPDTKNIEVSYNGKTASTDITVHAVTHHDRVDSTVEQTGVIEHYYCEDCGKYFDTGMNEVKDTVMPKMQPISVDDKKVTIINSDDKTVGLKTEGGRTFLAGNPGEYYGRIFMQYNVSVDRDTDILFYINTNIRKEENKLGDVYSVKINGVEITPSGAMMPCGTLNWFSDNYAFAGYGRLLAGQNNVIEVTRLNLINKELGGDKTYNFFGIGITPLTQTGIVLNEPCTHICPHCGRCTDAESTSPACADKCLGHEGEHFCESVCTICGGCTDGDCTEAACANKCEGCAEFTVMDDGVTVVDKDGGTVNKNKNEGNISANDSAVKKGYYKVTYNIHSDRDVTVKLFIKTCAQAIENSVASSYKFTVNGQPVEVDGSLTMPWNEANKWKDIGYTYIGEVHLKAGDNVIVIERPDMTDRENNDYTGYNFFGIALSGEADLTFSNKK